MDGIVTYETGWPELVNVRVTSESLNQKMIQTRQAAYANWGLDLPVNDAFDECPHTAGFLLKEHGRTVGTIRITVGNLPSGIVTPTFRTFGREIAHLVGTKSFVDVSRLAVLCPDQRRVPDCCFALFQNATAAADENECRYILASTRTDHTRFYEGMGFYQAAPPRAVSGWPVSGALILLDWIRYRGWICSHRRYRKVTSNRNIKQIAA